MVEAVGTNLLNDHSVKGIVLNIRDIGDRHKIEQALRNSENALREKERTLSSMISTLPGVVYQFYARPDGSTGMYYVSGKSTEMLALKPDDPDFVRNITESILPEDRQLFIDSIEEAIRNFSEWRYEGRRIRRTDGKLQWFSGHSIPQKVGDEIVFTGFLLDITESKLAQKELLESQEKFSRIFNLSPDMIGITRAADGLILDGNLAFSIQTGYTREEFIGKSVFELGLYSDPSVREHLMNVIEDEGELKDFELDMRLKSGEVRHCLLSIKPIIINGENCLSFIIHDITERKLAEKTIKSLNESLEKKLVALTRPVGDVSNLELSELFDIDEIQKIQDSFASATGVASIITEPDGTPITRPSNFCHLCENIIRKTEKGLANCLYSDAVIGAPGNAGPKMQHCLSGGLWDAGTSIYVGEKHIANWLIGQVLEEPVDEDSMLAYAREIGADEKEFRAALRNVTRMPIERFKQVSEFLYKIADQLSRLALQNIQQARFITEAKQFQKKLEESEKLFRQSIETLPLGCVISTVDGKIIFVNKTFTEHFGYTIEDMPTASDWMSKAYPDAEYREIVFSKWKQDVQRMISSGYHDAPSFVFDVTTKDGKILITEFRQTIIGDRVLILLNDITEQKHAEETLRKSEEFFRNTFENHSAVMLLVSPDTGRIIKANQAASNFYGWSCEKLSEMNIGEINTLTQQEITAELEKVRSQKRVQFEFRHRRADGSIRDVAVFSSNISSNGNDVLFSIIQDITERKQAEKDLRQAQALYRGVVESQREIIARFRTDGVFTFVNKAWQDYYRQHLDINESVIGRNISDYMQTENLDQIQRFLSNINPKDFNNSMERSFVNRDGETRWQHWQIQKIVNDESSQIEYQVVGNDITEQKRAEQALKESEARFHRMAQNIHDGLSIVENGRLVFINDRACEIFGHSQEEMSRIVSLDMATPEHKERINKLLKDYQSGQMVPWEVEFKIVRKDGEVRHLHNRYSVSELNDVQTIYVMTSDITEKVQALEALKISEERWQFALEGAGDGVWDWNTVTNRIFFSHQWKNMLGYSDDEVGSDLGEWERLVHPDDKPGAYAEIERHFKRQTEFYQTEYRMRCKDGSYKWILDRGKVIEWQDDGKPQRMIGTHSDITELKNKENLLRIERDFNQTLIHDSPLFFVAIKPGGEVMMMNKTMLTALGYESEEVVGKDYLEATAADEEYEKLRVAFSTIVDKRKGTQLSYRVRCKDGSTIPVEWHGKPIFLGDKMDFFIGIGFDITERERAEKEQQQLQLQLQQAMKMESVGRLAGGVAHDFNNLLTSISGNVELALSEVPKESGLHTCLAEVRKATISAASLIKQLLAFSRKQIIEPKVVDLNALISNMHKMLVRLIGEDINLKTIPQENIKSVRIDPSQFEQILVNLSVNARDAMPDGGVLTIETASVELDENYCRTHSGVTPGPYVMLAVSDTGYGMSEEVLEHIFEPFFTTKPKSEGTGLGLATAYGAVKQANGSIEVYSETGRGTTFKIYLPAVNEKAHALESDKNNEILLTGNETVLLVEDELMVRNLAVRLLGKMGYRVIEAANGKDALKLASDFSEKIDLLMTDVVMPGMNGRQLSENLKEIHPETKVLFTSGYTENIIAHHGVVEKGLNFIGKPYSMNLLARKIRETLDS